MKKKMILSVFVFCFISSCSSNHVLKGDLKTDKDITINVKPSDGEEKVKKATASAISGISTLMLIGGILALGNEYEKEKEKRAERKARR